MREGGCNREAGDGQDQAARSAHGRALGGGAQVGRTAMRLIIARGVATPGRRWASACLRAMAVVVGLGMAATGAAGAELRLATTHTINDSGLLDAVLPAFTRDTGIRVRPIVAGTGQALRLAERGDADLVWSHSPDDEARFIAAGFGVRRTIVMTNAFVLVGPSGDPAGIRGERDVVAALRRIAASKARFVSRADESGTHRKEVALWQAACMAPGGDWYVAAGVGMGATLRIADERAAYALCDEATFAALKSRLELRIASAGDPRLANIYAVVPVDATRVTGVDAAAADAFVRWVTTGRGRTLIAGYRVGGEAVFRVP
jgi:tungstate transport system substrate-binding protein